MRRIALLLTLCAIPSARSEDLGSPDAGHPAIASLERIDVWYGPHQRFGHLGGHPQKWVNVLGHVVTPEGVEIESVWFELNGGPKQPLSHREDNKRIARDGDFNIEVDRADLKNGRNIVRVMSILDTGTVLTEDVVIDYEADASRWPLPYEIDWSKADRIEDVAQVVDGKWKLTKDGVRSVERYYDRVIAFGDDTWTDYEVQTTVTVHELTGPKQGGNTTNVTHAAIALRWPGHDADGKQPTVKWYPVGATAEFRLGSDLTECRWRIFDGKGKYHRESKARRSIEFETPYHMKHRVETLADGQTLYRAKLWPVGESEPEAWDLERTERGDLTAGSALLIAHHSDVTFGNVRAISLLGESSVE